MDQAAADHPEDLHHRPGGPERRPKKRIVAEELNRALRNQDKWAEENKCPREAQFHELYEARGDREKQERIREKAERRSCYILLCDPDACDCLPEDIGEAEKGRPCPNNPFERNSELVAELEEQRPLLDLAGHLGDLAELYLADPAVSTAEEWAVIRIMMQRAKYQQAQAMQSGLLRVVHLKPGEEER